MKHVSIYFAMCMIIGISLLTSCGNSKKQEDSEITIEDKELPAEERAEKAAYDEVMAVHDEIMPKMDDMMKLKGKLQVALDTGREQENTDEERLKSLESAISQLEAADEAMMQWMRDFQPQDTVSDHEKVLAYYREQKEEIGKVKDKMLQAMGNARQQLGEE